MTTLKLISVSKPATGAIFKQEFEFDGNISHENGFEITYYDNTIDSETHVRLEKNKGFIKNKNLTINLNKNGSTSTIKTEHGDMQLHFVYKKHKINDNFATVSYAIFDLNTKTKLSDNLIRYEWGQNGTKRKT